MPIALTEALGCDRCQQIFAIEEGGYTITPISSYYAYRQSWHWTGQQWRQVHSGLQGLYLPLVLGMIFVFSIVWLLVAGQTPPKIGAVILAVIAMTVMGCLALLVWPTFRR